MVDLVTLFVVMVLLGIVALANLAEARPALRNPLVLALVVVNAFFAFSGASTPQSTSATAALAFGVAVLASLPLLADVRNLLARALPRRVTLTEGSDAGLRVGFDPDSPVHMTALVLCVLLIGNTALSFALAGGLGGLADAAQSGGDLVSVGGLLAQMLIFIAFAFVGVGLGTRRDLWQTLERLGLRAPTARELLSGAAMAFTLFWAAFFISAIWQALVPREVIEEQTQLSGLIAASVTSLFTAFALSATAAIGEEIAFRGALQPGFGIWPVSVIFALTHIQYTLTPATLVIFIVSLGFGAVRRRHNTTAAIVAHFLYNYALMAIAVYAQYVYEILELLQ
jgi:membrane protease YdiL (CAAX protease family)